VEDLPEAPLIDRRKIDQMISELLRPTLELAYGELLDEIHKWNYCFDGVDKHSITELVEELKRVHGFI
jgi:cell pole-organizing protein PopZ